MSWGPLQPARIRFIDGQAPAATDFADHYPDPADAPARARRIFLDGNQLPGRWAGRPRFVILETGFGLGHNFLATWAAWQQDPRRCGTLWYLAIDKHPPRRVDLARAHAASSWPAMAADLLDRWPPLTPDLHLMDFDGGRVRLLLALGDIAAVLPDLVAQVDAFYLDGFAPEGNPAMWDPYRLRQLPRLAASGARLAAACAASALRQGLGAAGFVVEPASGSPDLPEMTVAQFAPRFANPAPAGRQPLPRRSHPVAPQVAVIGAGLAGAAVAQVLAARGVAVRVFERRPHGAAETSGNAGGLFHGVVHANDGPHARWLRAAALHTERVLRPLVGTGTGNGAVPGAVAGLLRGEQSLAASGMQALIDRLALPADYVQVMQSAGRPARWLYPGGGWVSPAALCHHWLALPGVETHFDADVQSLQHHGERWQLLAADGRCLHSADAVVLCNAGDAMRLLSGLATGAPWPLRRVRGQVSMLPAALSHQPGLPALRQPWADTGYALRLADGRVLFGATSQTDDDEPGLRDADHLANLATLRRLTGWAGEARPGQFDGRVGWRLQSDDRLPLLGPVPDAQAAARLPSARHHDQPRHVPRHPGLQVFTALGSRGISHAALGAEVLASWLLGDPVPAPASLMDALDPARFIARAARRAG